MVDLLGFLIHVILCSLSHNAVSNLCILFSGTCSLLRAEQGKMGWPGACQTMWHFFGVDSAEANLCSCRHRRSSVTRWPRWHELSWQHMGCMALTFVAFCCTGQSIPNGKKQLMFAFKVRKAFPGLNSDT